MDLTLELIRRHHVCSKLLHCIKIDDSNELPELFATMIELFHAEFRSALEIVSFRNTSFYLCLESLIEHIRRNVEPSCPCETLPDDVWDESDPNTLHRYLTSWLRMILNHRLGRIALKYPRTMLVDALSVHENSNKSVVIHMESLREDTEPCVLDATLSPPEVHLDDLC